MNGRFKKILVIALAITLLLSLGLPAQAEEEKHLRVASSGTATGVFNPLLINDDYTSYVTSLVYDSLTKLTPAGEVIPNLAVSWEISEDQLTYTLHLAEDAKWHDGEDVTAEDVKFTYNFLASKDYAGPKASYCSPIKGFQAVKDGEAEELSGVKVIDEHTVEFTTEDVYAPFLSKCCFWIDIIPKHIWGEIPISEADQQTDLLHNPIGSGPFLFDEYVADQYSSLVKNENYWGGTPKLDRITYIVVNSDTSVAQLLSREIDTLSLSSTDPELVKMLDEAGLVLTKTKYNAYQDMIPNLDQEILNNKYVRQALTVAINRQGIVDALLFGNGNVANQAYPTTFWAYPGDDVLKPYDYDPEEAIRLLTEEAGWEYKDGVMYADGEPVSFTLTYPAGNKARELSAPVIKENLEDIGIALDLAMVEFATLIELVDNPEPDAFDFVLLGHGIGEDPDISALFASDSGSNFMRWKNEEADKLLAEGALFLDPEERKPIYKDLAILINEEMPTIFLYNWETSNYAWPDVKGRVPHPFDSSYNVLEWDLVPEE